VASKLGVCFVVCCGGSVLQLCRGSVLPFASYASCLKAIGALWYMVCSRRTDIFVGFWLCRFCTQPASLAYVGRMTSFYARMSFFGRVRHPMLYGYIIFERYGFCRKVHTTAWGRSGHRTQTIDTTCSSVDTSKTALAGPRTPALHTIQSRLFFYACAANNPAECEC